MLYVPDGSVENIGVIGTVSAAKRCCAVMPQQNAVVLSCHSKTLTASCVVQAIYADAVGWLAVDLCGLGHLLQTDFLGAQLGCHGASYILHWLWPG